MNESSRKWLTVAAFVGLLGLTLALFLIQPSQALSAKNDALTLASPFFQGLAGLRERFDGYFTSFETLEQLRLSKRALEEENARLRTENATFRNLERENQQLKEALNFQQSTSFRLMVARVIAREPTTWWRYVTVDRGAEDGVKEQQAVVSTQGLVGKISSVTPGTSKIVLLGDEACRVSAVLENSTEQGIVMGMPTEDGTIQARMTFISSLAVITPGQKVYTSGLGQIFPPGLLIGEVAELVPKKEVGGFGLYQEIIIKPAADFSEINELFVVMGRKNEKKSATDKSAGKSDATGVKR